MISATPSFNLAELEKTLPTRVESFLEAYFSKTCLAPTLLQAMRYGVMNGGKRIRPLLVYAVGTSFGASLEACDVPACAIELIHGYSLIHDDLPAMDNADIRRGLPSCHKQYNEAMAILAGDTLQTLAFEILATHPSPLTSNQRISMISTLTQASGFEGMGGGQALDLQGVDTLEKIEQMYLLKTGALLEASIQLGLCAANIHNEHITRQLKKFAQTIGLAFQIQDDLLDVQNETITGKPQHLDLANNKITYSTLLGIPKTQLKLNELFARAIEIVHTFGEKGNVLVELAETLLKRRN